MLSVFVRAVVIIALIFFYSPLRTTPDASVSTEPLAFAELRKGLDHFDAPSLDGTSLARLWDHVPAKVRKDAAGSIAMEAADALLAPAPEQASQDSRSALPDGASAWPHGRPRRIYP